jgi:hypothetical protein
MKLKRTVKWLVMSLALGAVGCGDDLVDGEFKGEPIYAVSGEIESLAPSTQRGRTKVAIAWVNFAVDGDFVTVQGADVAEKSFPFDYEMRLLDAPPDAALNFFDPAKLGTGHLVVYEDVDGDGALDPEKDTLRGMAENHMVLYVPEVNPAVIEDLRRWGRIVNVDVLQPGFNLARGICTGYHDDLELIPNESVPIIDFESARTGGCLNYH